MQLTVPQRTVADTGSFPVDPEGVAQWLAGLNPVDSEADAHEVYRGLKHSNRLHNDVARRRSVISCFVPVLRDLNHHLSEQSNAQPLPLSREFARSARLRGSLLREEAFAFKILLADSDKPMADDARRAMQALARQAESVVHGYRAFPDKLIEDAHQLYTLAEKHDLLLEEQSLEHWSLMDHYRYILLLSIAQLTQHRSRQLPLVLQFLKGCVPDIQIETQPYAQTMGKTDYVINLSHGSRPEPALSVLSTTQSELRWFSVAPILFKVHEESPHGNARSSSLLDNDILERQSLARLHVALARSRHRRLARCITMQQQSVMFGHKDICAHLLYRSAAGNIEHELGWAIINQTPHGACLRNQDCRAGLVQVGELISMTNPDTASLTQASASISKVETTLAVIRWINANGDQDLTIGVEFLARSALPVLITRAVSDSLHTSGQSANDVEVGEHALIIACKVQNKVMQTMLLPSFLYKPEERLVATQGARSRKVQLGTSLQNNGLFTQFLLVDG